MYRIHIDETRYTDLQLLSWHFALPKMYLPIIDRDRKKVSDYQKSLSEAFSKQAINAAVKRLKLRQKCGKGKPFE